MRVVTVGGRTLIVELAPGVELFNLAEDLSNSEIVESVNLINGEPAVQSDIEHLKSLLGSRAANVRIDGQQGSAAAIPGTAQSVTLSREAKGA